MTSPPTTPRCRLVPDVSSPSRTRAIGYDGKGASEFDACQSGGTGRCHPDVARMGKVRGAWVRLIGKREPQRASSSRHSEAGCRATRSRSPAAAGWTILGWGFPAWVQPLLRPGRIQPHPNPETGGREPSTTTPDATRLGCFRDISQGRRIAALKNSFDAGRMKPRRAACGAHGSADGRLERFSDLGAVEHEASCPGRAAFGPEGTGGDQMPERIGLAP